MPQRSAPSPTPFLNHLKRVKTKLTPRLKEVLAASESLALSRGKEVGAMAAAVTSLCDRGGKRLRPGLCVTGAICVQDELDWNVL
ncbi:MAG: hypothetical protein MK135_06705, partial [Polyangiaceae bacterium]|nr:hypothetical protein [Polyangiaceae bacterium]